MGKIAVALEQAVRRRVELGQPGEIAATVVGSGDGWVARDLVCTSGPDTRPFEERHQGVALSVVLAGTFQYRTNDTQLLLTPGSVLLGNDGQAFECAHEHAAGDRCVAFHFTPDAFERIAFDAGWRGGPGAFRVGRLPPLRAVAGVGARVAAGVLGGGETAWDELAVELAATAARVARGLPGSPPAPPRGAESRVTAGVRAIARDPAVKRTLRELAREARLSEFHYLRTFARVTGATPHQFILRTRLREAAARLATTRRQVAAVALDSGFDDLAHFNHSFKAEFGVTPRAFRQRCR